MAVAAMGLGDEALGDVAVLERHLAGLPEGKEEKAQALFAEIEAETASRDRRLDDLNVRVQGLEDRVAAMEGGSCCWNILAIIGIVALAILMLLAGALLIVKAVR